MSVPDLKWKSFPLELAAWKNEKDGREYYSFKLTKAYKDDKGEWHNTANLSDRDLPIAVSLLSRAHMELGIQKGT